MSTVVVGTNQQVSRASGRQELKCCMEIGNVCVSHGQRKPSTLQRTSSIRAESTHLSIAVFVIAVSRLHVHPQVQTQATVRTAPRRGLCREPGLGGKGLHRHRSCTQQLLAIGLLKSRRHPVHPPLVINLMASQPFNIV